MRWFQMDRRLQSPQFIQTSLFLITHINPLQRGLGITRGSMPNRLATSTSPYLLQHQTNPVDWYPWCEEAFELAKHADKPVFLSIGYSACHWCHVMAHESFESPAIAQILNEHFVSIKVDREQRPDIDHIYMQTVQMLTGSGGWPLSVFLTPEGRPFYAGTYWPPTERWGRPGFNTILNAVVDSWKNRREPLLSQANELTHHLQPKPPSEPTPVSSNWEKNSKERADQTLAESFDSKHGGFGRAPKFPHALDLRLLMAIESHIPSEPRLQRITKTLDAMLQGGIYDQLAGGFARYSTDDRWLVPHFEKMLYDNALLVQSYLDGYLLTGNQRYAEVIRQTLDYVLSDLTDALGGFYSARDADSEGVEGKYYVWSREEILQELGQERGNQFCEAYGVTFGGNFDGMNVLYEAATLQQVAHTSRMSIDSVRQQLAEDRLRLLELRKSRPSPSLDDKVLCSWNGMMIASMARAGMVLGERKYLAAATHAASLIVNQMMSEEGELKHSWRKGVAETTGFLEDYAHCVEAFLVLLECTGEHRYLDQALIWMEFIESQFGDESGGYYFTSKHSEKLITRFKDDHDGSTPSANSVMTMNLVRVARLIPKSPWLERAERQIGWMRQGLPRSTAPYGQFLLAVDYWCGPTSEILLIAKDEDTLREALIATMQKYLPRTFVIGVVANSREHQRLKNGPLADHLHGKELPPGAKVVTYRCIENVCHDVQLST